MIEIVLGLGFGDEGKGSIVDWLARRAATPPLVVRWNGGPQAAHHVVTDDGRVHCFAQLGAGSFVAGARTHLGPDMAVDPYALREEATAFAPDALASVTIDPRAILVTPWHAIVNRIREVLRGDARHGTTGRGVAEAKLGGIAVVAGQIGPALAEEVERLRGALAATAAELVSRHPDPPEAARALAARARDPDLVAAFLDAAHALGPADVVITTDVPVAEHVILEGAHGALLDRDHGFFPHVTPSRITRAAAEDALRAMALTGPTEVWGVLRAFHTRHGAGPLPSHVAALDAQLVEPHNPDDGWAGSFRVGWFDAVLARHALTFAGPIDRLAITCLDRAAAVADPAIVEAWQTPDGTIADLTGVPADRRTAVASAATPIVRPVAALGPAIAEILGRPLDLESWGPTATGKRARR